MAKRFNGKEKLLSLRRPPAQGRGVVTFEKVLATAGRLLNEVGAEGLTTNLIASESQVNISSIYKYFPNKQAILKALFEKQVEERGARVRSVIAELGVAQNWRRVVDRLIDRIAQSRRVGSGSEALRHAMRSAPELADIERRAIAQWVGWFAIEIQKLASLGPRQATTVARLLVETIVGLLDWWETPECNYDTNVLRELKASLKAYLSLYADRNVPAVA